MPRAMAKTRRHKRKPKAKVTSGITPTDIFKHRLTMTAAGETVDYAAFLSEQHAKQAAGLLRNPKQTGPLLDRLEDALRRAPR